ncbi:uncharacterized protein BJX67DRAFT_380258 [Aspergillus lucknowensis]|uniref:Aminoglycoside phosphotransferase domain-containing protein n=1 Tax=Aspergillus lucknowensis TaxID=176173 RepID=A0ABR4LU68_9EURO
MSASTTYFPYLFEAMASSFLEKLLTEYSDSELAQQIVSSPWCTSSSRVVNLSPNLIAKRHDSSEVEDVIKATEVASQLGIRCPFIRKTIKTERNVYIIMDRLEGTTLDVVWKELGWFMTVKLALQLRRFVKMLRSVTSPTAGSLVTGECRSFWLEDYYGLPANSGPAEFAHFFLDEFYIHRASYASSKAARSA